MTKPNETNQTQSDTAKLRAKIAKNLTDRNVPATDSAINEVISNGGNTVAVNNYVNDYLQAQAPSSNTQSGEQDSPKSSDAGQNLLIDFINNVSDSLSSEVADGILAATFNKALTKLGTPEGGELTKRSMAQVGDAVSQVSSSIGEMIKAHTDFTQKITEVNGLPSLISSSQGGQLLLSSGASTAPEKNSPS